MQLCIGLLKCKTFHFSGVKSDDPAAPNYIPTIFPNKLNITTPRTTKNSQKKSGQESPQSVDACSTRSSPIPESDITMITTPQVSNTNRPHDHSYTSATQNREVRTELQIITCIQKLQDINMSTEQVLHEHDYVATYNTAKPPHPDPSLLTQHIQEQQNQIRQLETSLGEAQQKILSVGTIQDKTECRQWTGLNSYAVFEQLLTLIMNTVWNHSSR